MTETTINNYQERASRTLSKLPYQAADGAHMALGIATEIGELKKARNNKDLQNIREEHGDINWYIANECNIYGISFKDLYETAKEYRDAKVSLTFKLDEFLDVHKRELAYGKKIEDHDMFDEMLPLVMFLMDICEWHGFSYEDALKINIEKLYVRYPEKFTNEDALNRNLDKEKEVL